MAQHLFMVLVDTTEATPREMCEKLEKFLQDEFSGFALTAIETVLYADDRNIDEELNELEDVLSELQFKVDQERT